MLYVIEIQDSANGVERIKCDSRGYAFVMFHEVCADEARRYGNCQCCAFHVALYEREEITTGFYAEKRLDSFSNKNID